MAQQPVAWPVVKSRSGDTNLHILAAGRGLWNRQSVLSQSFQVQFDTLPDQAQRLLPRLSNGNTTDHPTPLYSHQLSPRHQLHLAADGDVYLVATSFGLQVQEGWAVDLVPLLDPHLNGIRTEVAVLDEVAC